MVKPKPPNVPDSWGKDRHEEVEGFGLGRGFALFVMPGEFLRGILRTFFPTKHGPAVSIELTEIPSVEFFETTDTGDKTLVHPDVGGLVNLSLSSVDLGRKIGEDLLDKDIGVQYLHDVATRAGQMKVYRVLVFDTETSRLVT